MRHDLGFAGKRLDAGLICVSQLLTGKKAMRLSFDPGEHHQASTQSPNVHRGRTKLGAERRGVDLADRIYNVC